MSQKNWSCSLARDNREDATKFPTDAHINRKGFFNLQLWRVEVYLLIIEIGGSILNMPKYLKISISQSQHSKSERGQVDWLLQANIKNLKTTSPFSVTTGCSSSTRISFTYLHMSTYPRRSQSQYQSKPDTEKILRLTGKRYDRSPTGPDDGFHAVRV